MFVEQDWEALHEMFRDPECVRYTVGAPLATWQTWRSLAAYLGHWQLRGYGPYAVVEKASGAMMGPVGLWCPGEWPGAWSTCSGPKVSPSSSPSSTGQGTCFGRFNHIVDHSLFIAHIAELHTVSSERNTFHPVISINIA
jgi:hypothetical protein